MRDMLSVDWDFFFNVPEIYELDWGHDEGFHPALQEMLWKHRASNFQLVGDPLPMTSGDEVGFWDRFRFTKDARLFIADSHMHAVDTRVHTMSVRRVWNYDAHHDAGYRSLDRLMKDGYVDCSDWMAYYQLCGAKCHVVYPSWRADHHLKASTQVPVSLHRDGAYSAPRVPFSTVFVCRSSSWVPPWLDLKFVEFLSECPIKDIVFIQDVEPRRWVPAEIDEMTAHTRKYMEENNASAH